jgi:hypothetical protein
MIDHLKELTEAGVDCIKIEGRAKSAYYAAIVTGAYRHVIDDIAAGRKPDPVWRDEVDHVSHRIYSTGFYYGFPGQYTENSRYIREWQVCAIVESCDENGMALCSLRNKFRAGDELELVKSGSSTAYIARGHRLRVDMLVEAMLLPSGNDAAYILAAAAGRAIAPNRGLTAKEAVAVFVSEMNQEAFRLGLVNSNFTNPDGFHDEYHFSCPQDVAIFSALAMKEPVIAKYAKLCADAVTFESGQIITWYNTNRLVNPKSDSYCPQAIGAKTGFTTEAGYCLLAAFQEGDKQLIVGIFGSDTPYDRYDDAAALWELCR